MSSKKVESKKEFCFWADYQEHIKNVYADFEKEVMTPTKTEAYYQRPFYKRYPFWAWIIFYTLFMGVLPCFVFKPNLRPILFGCTCFCLSETNDLEIRKRHAERNQRILAVAKVQLAEGYIKGVDAVIQNNREKNK